MALKRCFIKTLLALIAVCAFIACTNPADGNGGGDTGGGNTPSVPEVPAPGQIRIMITGDERVDPYKSYIDTAKNTTWGAIKTQIETKLTLKTAWRGGNYGVYAWKLGSENGAVLTDGHPFAEGATVYAVTNYIKFRMNGTVLEGYDGAKPRGRIIIPDTVTRIKEEAFKDCTALTGTLVFPRSLKEIEGAVFNGAFQNCIRLTGLDFSACTELTEIGYYAFANCSGLTGSLDLSACTKLTKIREKAFKNCSGFTGEPKLSPNLSEIGDGAFWSCRGLTGSLDLSVYTQLTKIGSYAFYDCSGFTGELKLPVNLTEIGERAFSGCRGFTGSLDLSACSKLTKIENYAFSVCSGFTGELKLPANITEIASNTFSYCSGFTGSLDLSACTKLTKIEYAAFRNCSGFTGELKLPVSLTGIGNDAFSGCTQAEIKLSQNITDIDSGAFGKAVDSYCKKVKIPNGTRYDLIKVLVKQSSYPEERIEAY